MTVVEIGSDSVAVPLSEDEVRPESRLDAGHASDIDTIASKKESDKNKKDTKKKNKKQKEKEKKGKDSSTKNLKKEKQEISHSVTHHHVSRRKKCGNCCKQFVAFLFSTVGLTCLMVGYATFGGFIFMQIEGPYEIQIKSNVSSSKMLHIEMLWNLTLDMNVFYPPNWTEMAERVLDNYTKHIYLATKKHGWDGKDGPQELQWTFPGSLLYSITVITTIGYGHITPKTDIGRVVTIFYAIVGIPLTLLTIANLGGYMATAFRLLYKNICCGLFCCDCCKKPKVSKKAASRHRDPAARYKDPQNGEAGASRALTEEEPHDDICPQQRDLEKQLQQQFTDQSHKLDMELHWKEGVQTVPGAQNCPKSQEKIYVPMYISLLLIATYIMSGALLFTIWEPDWDYLIGSYFCFITLTTVGFGDFVPGTSLDTWGSQEKLVLCCLYLLFGLALIAMCFDLMQEEARNIARNFARKIGLIK